jgi:hypothetical protein
MSGSGKELLVEQCNGIPSGIYLGSVGNLKVTTIKNAEGSVLKSSLANRNPFQIYGI